MTTEVASMTASKKYSIYSVFKYDEATHEKMDKLKFTSSKIERILKRLENDNYYNFRVNEDGKYIFFGDLDYYDHSIDIFKYTLNLFLKKYYNLSFTDEEFKYTTNNKAQGSYHYSIPKWNGSTKKIKEIHENLSKIFKDEFKFLNEKNVSKSRIDTSIYSNHWYRCPNQSKGTFKNRYSQHKIQHGKMLDFIIDYIPEHSINIDNIEFIEEKQSNKLITKKNTENRIEKITNLNNQDKTDIIPYNKEQILSNTMSQSCLYKQVFDQCYSKQRFDEYCYWIAVGMAIKNTFIDYETAFELFNYYSAKGSNYDGAEKTRKKFNTLIKTTNSNGYTVATIHYYAIEDNKPKFVEIMSKNTFELEQTDVCKYLKIIAGYKFIYQKIGDRYVLYCYNGKYWQNDDILLRHCISTEIFDFLKNILVDVYWDNKEFAGLKKKLKKLKTMSYKKEIVETYKEYGVNNEIIFDNKWWLFGFNNLVYDMEEECFREYKYDDYVSITCGYDWREPTDEEINTVNKLIETIMPIEEERNAYLQILCTGIDGRCLEKFIIFNGSGGNGKGLIDDFMLVALGNYGILGNNGILFEASKTGSNPEKANLHKKRFVVFREPPDTKKFENSIIKEMTGGGSFSARTHNEKETQKELNLTMVVECNKKPLFHEEPTDAEIRRIIDFYFRASFVTDKSIIDHEKYVYMADPVYKTKEFQHKHKFALIKILLNEHKKYYKKNNSILQIPKSIISRTQAYLEMSCDIVQWFKEKYELTEKKEDMCQIKDIYEEFVTSEYHSHLTKAERKKYTKTYVYEYFKTNIFFKKYYHERFGNLRNIMKGWKKIEETDDDNNIHLKIN